VGDEGQKEDGEEGKSGSAEAGAEWHEVTSGIKDNVANMGERLGAGCSGGGIQVSRLLTRSESGSMIQQLTVASQESEKYFNGRR
jgi:ribulose 1,5-bisphosphate synthetase/thiazole synthase